MQMVYMVPEKTEASSAAKEERHYSSSLPASSKAAMITEELWPPHIAAGSTFHWNVMECWITVVFLKAINILLCTDFYLQHSLIKSCDLHK